MHRYFLFIFFLFVQLSTQQNCSGVTSTIHFYPGSLPYHQTGFACGNDAWCTNVDEPNNVFLTYGPYTDQISNLPSRVDFLLSIDNNSNDNLPILFVDVNDAERQQVRYRVGVELLESTLWSQGVVELLTPTFHDPTFVPSLVF